MRIRICAALLIALLSISLLTGCAFPALEARLSKMDTPVDAPAQPAAPPAVAPAAPANLLTEDEAKTLALTHAGFTAGQVRHLRVEPELYDRVPHYDVEFEEGRWEYEYEIHAETGAVLSFGKDD